MFNYKKPLLAVALILPAAAFASSVTPASEPSAEVVSQIHEILSAQGYQVEEIELEDGGFEVETSKDGAAFEVYMDAELNILKTEEEDAGTEAQDEKDDD